MKDTVKISEQCKEWPKGTFITLDPHSREIIVWMREDGEMPDFKDGYFQSFCQSHEVSRNEYCLEEDYEGHEFSYKVHPVIWDCDKLIIEGEL